MDHCPEHTSVNAVVNITAITTALIEVAVNEEDLNEALYPLQAAAGITSGDVAGAFFSGSEDEEWWASASPEMRRKKLDEYISLEATYCSDDGKIHDYQFGVDVRVAISIEAVCESDARTLLQDQLDQAEVVMGPFQSGVTVRHARLRSHLTLEEVDFEPAPSLGGLSAEQFAALDLLHKANQMAVACGLFNELADECSEAGSIELVCSLVEERLSALRVTTPLSDAPTVDESDKS